MIYKYILLIVLLSSGCSNSIIPLGPAIPPFQKFYGLSHEDEEAVSIINAYGGGYIAVGINEAIGAIQDSASDICLLKIAEDGTMIGNYVLNCHDYDDVHSITHTSDGGYILAGRTFLLGTGGSEIIIIKLSANLDVLWSRTYGGGVDDRPLSVKQTLQGDLIIVGATASYGAGSTDVIVIKTNSAGDLIWSRVLGGTGFDLAHSVVVNEDGSFLVTGWITANNSENIAVIKFNAGGDISWQKLYGGTGSDLAFAIAAANNGNYVLAGSTRSFSSNDDIFILNINGSGDVNYFNTFSGGMGDQGRDIERTPDGGYAIGGLTYSSGSGEGDAMLLKLNSQGSLQFAHTYGGNTFDVVYSVIPTGDGGYIMPGSTVLGAFNRTDVRIIKASSTGESCGSRSFTSIFQSSPNITSYDPALIPIIPPLQVNNAVVTISEFDAVETVICTD